MHASNPFSRRLIPTAAAAALALGSPLAHADFSATASISGLSFRAVQLDTGAPGVPGVSYAFVDPAGNYPAYYLDVADSAAAAWGANLKQDALALPAGGTSPLPAAFANGLGIDNASSTLWTTSTSITGMAAANGAGGLRMAGLAASFGETYTAASSYFDVVSLAPHTSLIASFDLSMLLHQGGQCNAGQCDAAFAEIIVGYNSTPDSGGNSDSGTWVLSGPTGGGISASPFVVEPYASFVAADITNYQSSEHHEFVLTNTKDTAAAFNFYGVIYADGQAVSSVPEPAAWLLLAAGLPLLALRRRRIG
jgi:hypothetical protein